MPLYTPSPFLISLHIRSFYALSRRHRSSFRLHIRAAMCGSFYTTCKGKALLFHRSPLLGLTLQCLWLPLRSNFATPTLALSSPCHCHFLVLKSNASLSLRRLLSVSQYLMAHSVSDCVCARNWDFVLHCQALCSSISIQRPRSRLCTHEWSE